MTFRLSLLCLLAVAAPVLGQEKLPAQANLAAEFSQLGIAPVAQGGRDTCSLCAVTALADFERARQTPPDQRQRLSAEFLVWAANRSTGLRGDQAMFYEAVHGLNELGICAATLMPYEARSDRRRRPSEQALADAKQQSQRWRVQWIKRWDLSRGLGDDELLAIKQAIATGHPVACGLRWPKELEGASLDLIPADAVFDGHSIAFTGYADDESRPGEGVLHFRNSFGGRWGEAGQGSMTYAYARANGNDALRLELGPPGSQTPVERFEAESLTILTKEKCEATAQKMDRYGGGMWSGAEQLFCSAAEGARLQLGFQVGKSGRYRPRLLATAAPDFGKLRITLDDQKQATEFDLYAGRVSPSGSLDLPEQELTAGDHTLQCEVSGKNPASTNFAFGLDAVDLLPVGESSGK